MPPPARHLRAAVLAFLLGLAAILTAWSFQIFGGYVPCKLCLEQRVPYYVGLPVLAVGIILLMGRRNRGFGRALLILGGAIFLVGAGLGAYHSGVEWGFWAGPSDCGGATSTTSNAADLLNQLSHTRVVSCSDAALRVLGLSFAGWNVVVSLVVSALALTAALRR